jgi:hypothetical protein
MKTEFGSPEKDDGEKADTAFQSAIDSRFNGKTGPDFSPL